MYTYMYMVIYIYIYIYTYAHSLVSPYIKHAHLRFFKLPMCAQPTTAAAETLKGILLRSCLRLSKGLNGGHGEAVGE